MGIAFLLFALLASSLPGSEDYLSGRRAEKERRFGDASTAYEACASQEGPLQAFAQARRAACRAGSGDVEGAIAAYGKVLRDFPEGPWVPMVQAELAALYTRAGDASKARSSFERILAPELTPWWFDRYQWSAAESLAQEPAMAAPAYAFWRRLLEDPGYRGRRYDAAERLAQSPEPADRWLAAESLVKFGAVKVAHSERTPWRTRPFVP